MTQERILSLKVGGIIGGVSWHSTKQLYEYINARVAEEKGGHNCAKLVLINVNLQDILDAPDADAKGAVLVDAAIRAEKAGADFVALGSNGLHQYAERVEKAIRIPFIHIADVTADAIMAAGYQTVGLLGVKETMEQGFYKDRLAKRGLRVLIPEQPERDFINTVLFEETGVGIVKESSKQAFYRMLTTYSYSEYMINNFDLPTERVRHTGYEGGHMSYIGEAQCAKFGDDLRRFVKWATKKQ